MKFANYIEYVDDQDAIAAVRPTHRAYLAGLLERGQLAVAGPFDDGAGALFVYEAEGMETAKKFAAEDPYTLAGVIRNQTIHPWNLVYSNTALLQQPAD
jgi:uncharacterized protein YciI